MPLTPFKSQCSFIDVGNSDAGNQLNPTVDEEDIRRLEPVLSQFDLSRDVVILTRGEFVVSPKEDWLKYHRGLTMLAPICSHDVHGSPLRTYPFVRVP